MKTNALALIEHLIECTKNEEISWKSYSKGSPKVKPTYTSPLDLPSLSRTVTEPILINNESYSCTYDNGCFFLLLYRSITSSTKIELRVQTNSSVNSKVCASSTDSNPQIASQLKRLYNLVECKPDFVEIDEFINAFLKNE